MTSLRVYPTSLLAVNGDHASYPFNKELFEIGLSVKFTKENNMAKVLSIVCALLIAAGITASLQAQTFKVQKFSIGGEGGTDYLTAEPGTGRVFVSRGSHVMVIDGNKGTVIGDIPETPNTHGIALVAKYNHGFTTNRGDSTVSMFDITTLALIKKIKIPAGGQDGIMYDDFLDRIILTNHSKPGTATAIAPSTGVITGQAQLEDDSPEGAASDGTGKLFVNNERKNTIQVLDAKTMNVLVSWPLDPCEGPTGIAYDRASDRIFSGCGKTSAVVDAKTGKIVATIPNGQGVDALGWDPLEKLIYIPAGRDSSVTIVHEDSPDKYSIVASVMTANGAKTISVDTVKHVAYLFQPVYGPPPANAPQGEYGRRPRGPVVGAFLYVISH
jgi:DNA-binding beta-propeller fold protein YncE